ncbi:nucleoside triphosphate pyrophosphohydrolase [Capnocytophaga sp. oral taxon 338]|uniref:nucleoside triphosphate pyrophosphohydrolase n=1 Tax=Capnocytophaga sp. oral taxon 338 TaxID=710239 RepID=UPI000202F4D6|nr:nucleoside triphosphate pyrophosphohydrolase [Capnocytophaga sp. oral taxon 338]EGD34312.1 MazG protein [Capnocytophaga sp. oral taxon 338 str. F0234]
MKVEREKQLQAFSRLLDIMDELREKCPWDRKQTMQTLRPLTIEELYELTDAILQENPREIQKELGDILLHIVFYAKIASETQLFDLEDVINSICEKLIERHPHIYGNISVANEEEVKQNWEKIKLKTGSKGVLSGVPKSLPSLVKAYRIQEKVAGVGFDWKHKEQVWKKIHEELQELQDEVTKKNKKEAEREMGDVFFSLINYARFLKINPENALSLTNEKFIQRFGFLENRAKEQGREITELSSEEMNELWEESKTYFP